MLLTYLLLHLFPALITATTLTLSIPSTIPPLPPSTTAILTTHGHRLKAPITRLNTFVFRNLTSPPAPLPSADTSAERATTTVEYLLDIACRDYDFLSYGVDVGSDGVVRVYRVGRGGVVLGEKVPVGEAPVEVRVLKGRDFYEARAGFAGMERRMCGEHLGRVTTCSQRWLADAGDAVSPLDLLKNPMILIAVVGLAFVFGMPYLMDNMDPEMKKEFEEQQKKSILSGGASTANPLQNFDMAGWMAAKTSGTSGGTEDEGEVRRR